MLTDYVFVNEDFEKMGAGGYGDIEIAENRAKYLAQKYKCQIFIYEFIETIEAPEKEVE